MKPRIYKNYYGWVCSGGGHAVYGISPSNAYQNWIQNFINIRWPAIAYQSELSSDLFSGIATAVSGLI